MLNFPNKVYFLRKDFWPSYTVIKGRNIPCSSFIPEYSFLSILKYKSMMRSLTYNNLITMDYLSYAENI